MDWLSKCYSPSTTWNETEHNSHQSHEFRLSTPDDWRFRGIVGAFWEQLKIEDQLNWLYKTLPACTTTVTAGCLTDIGPAPDTTVSDPNTRNDNVAFFNDVHRGYKQLAFFTSLDFDIIPKVLTVTAGTRHYDFDNTEKGAVSGSFFCYEAGPAPCLAYATNVDGENLHTEVQGRQEPSQSDVARPAGCAGLLHVVAGFSARRFQSEFGLLHPGRHRVSRSTARRCRSLPTI